jgi:hypothetical protein
MAGEGFKPTFPVLEWLMTVCAAAVVGQFSYFLIKNILKSTEEILLPPPPPISSVWQFWAYINVFVKTCT